MIWTRCWRRPVKGLAPLLSEGCAHLYRNFDRRLGFEIDLTDFQIHLHTLDSAKYAPIVSPAHLCHNCDQICDRNCDINCDANFGPDQLHGRIHFRIRSTFFVHGYAQKHTSHSYGYATFILLVFQHQVGIPQFLTGLHCTPKKEYIHIYI